MKAAISGTHSDTAGHRQVLSSGARIHGHGGIAMRMIILVACSMLAGFLLGVLFISLARPTVVSA